MKIENPKLTAVNPHFKSRYAPLDEVLRVVEAGIPKGHTIHQTCFSTSDGVFFVTILLNTKGEEVKACTIPFPQTGKAQELGSALTYCRRYGLCLLFNLVGEDDDDGNAASVKPKKSKPKATKPKAQPKDNDEDDW